MFLSRNLFLTLAAILSLATYSCASTAFSRKSITPVFAIPRGGGLFGGGKDSNAEDSTPSPDIATLNGDLPTYPPMTVEEVEEWLDHIPVFAVTDATGQGVVLRPDDETSVFYFFMSPIMANATLSQLKESSSGQEMDLRISAFSLGKIWFSILNASEEKEVLLKAPGSEDGSPTKGVQYRLVPDTRDLLGARMLLTMNPEDGEMLKDGKQMSQEMAQAAIKKAMTESPKFNSTFNEIPVFLIAQMRMQKQSAAGEKETSEPMLPMYFSLQNMVSTWQQFMSQAPSEMQGLEPAINLMSLHDLVDMMQKTCPIDFRNVILVPPTPVSMEGGASVTAQSNPTDTMATMGGSTLGDL